MIPAVNVRRGMRANTRKDRDLPLSTHFRELKHTVLEGVQDDCVTQGCFGLIRANKITRSRRVRFSFVEARARYEVVGTRALATRGAVGMSTRTKLVRMLMPCGAVDIPLRRCP